MSESKHGRGRKKARASSGKHAPWPPQTRGPKLDRRVRRTRDALGDALVALMHERPFESIKVQHVLERAGVARSTFYEHFRDTDDLLMSDAEEFFDALANALSEHGDRSERVFPVREFFAHVAEMRVFFANLVESGRVHDNLELARGQFARGIERRLGELPRARANPAKERPAVAQAHAGALLALLQWWLRSAPRESPERMDALFHRTVWGGAYAETASGGGGSASALHAERITGSQGSARRRVRGATPPAHGPR